MVNGLYFRKLALAIPKILKNRVTEAEKGSIQKNCVAGILVFWDIETLAGKFSVTEPLMTAGMCFSVGKQDLASKFSVTEPGGEKNPKQALKTGEIFCSIKKDPARRSRAAQRLHKGRVKAAQKPREGHTKNTQKPREDSAKAAQRL